MKKLNRKIGQLWKFPSDNTLYVILDISNHSDPGDGRQFTVLFCPTLEVAKWYEYLIRSDEIVCDVDDP